MRNSLFALMLGGALLSGCNSVMTPSRPDDNWAVHTFARFTFYVRSGSFGEQSLPTLNDVLTDQFTSTVRALNLRYDGHISIFLYNNGTEAGFGNDGDGGNHSGVAYPKTETVKTVAVPPLDGNLMSLVSHEANHVIVENGLGRPGTTFVNEGLASALVSERYHSLGPTFLHQWVGNHSGQIPALANLVDDDKWNSYSSQVAYNASASFLAYLLETYGADRLRALYPSEPKSFVPAFSGIYGITLDQAETSWRAYCDARR